MASGSLEMLKKTGNNKASDECYTPNEAVTPLLKYLDKDKVWYEATSGLSKNIVMCMRSNGYVCMESEGDFFNQQNVYDGVVTNPPYSIKDRFIKRCY